MPDKKESLTDLAADLDDFLKNLSADNEHHRETIRLMLQKGWSLENIKAFLQSEKI